MAAAGATGGASTFERFARRMYEQAPDGRHTAVLSAAIARDGHGGEGVRYFGADGTGIHQPSMTHRTDGPAEAALGSRCLPTCAPRTAPRAAAATSWTACGG
ncbi:hypothetical protein [Dactylosporangium sp. NPDC000521]|uniref:hypothetical protein n=1 Tax=Dactylosporangium sp. NPDC000521 TaxID=3363975 RepID=UPI0036A9E5C2